MLAAEFNEVNGITGHADCKLRIFFGVFLRVEKHFAVEYVYVKMISARMNVTVYHRRKVFYAFFFRRAERGGRCAERVGNSVASELVRNFRNRFELSKRAVSVSAVHWVRARGERFARSSSVGSVARLFAVNNVGSYRENRHCRYGIAISVTAADFFHERFDDPYGDFVRALVVIAVFGEVSLDAVIVNKTVGVSYRVNLGVSDSRKGIRRAGKPRDARCEKSAYFRIVQTHFESFVRIFTCI